MNGFTKYPHNLLEGSTVDNLYFEALSDFALLFHSGKHTQYSAWTKAMSFPKRDFMDDKELIEWRELLARIREKSYYISLDFEFNDDTLTATVYFPYKHSHPFVKIHPPKSINHD